VYKVQKRSFDCLEARELLTIKRKMRERTQVTHRKLDLFKEERDFHTEVG
jgi:hypothetical protein